MSSALFIGVDWGTTNLRGWLIDARGQPLDSRSSDEGMGSLSRDDFAAALERLTAGWPDLPVLASGMVGARQGWIEAAYVTSPATAPALASALTEAPGRPDVQIVPGVAKRCRQGHLLDVMRGEETQAMGVMAMGGPATSVSPMEGVTAERQGGLLVCPGTHSKWIALDQDGVGDFATFMTGELNALIGQQSVLRHSVGGEPGVGPQFIAAVREMLDGASLSERLFSVRVASLDGRQTPQDAASRLSGLVIGAEIAAGLARFGLQDVSIIGSDRLNTVYAAALAEAGFETIRTIDGATAACLGLHRIWSSRA